VVAGGLDDRTLTATLKTTHTGPGHQHASNVHFVDALVGHFKDLKLHPTADMSEPDKWRAVLFDLQRSMQRWPPWWLRGEMRAQGSSHRNGKRPASYTDPMMWTGTIVTPNVQLFDADFMSMVTPPNSSWAVFEHDGMAGAYAIDMCWRTSHIAGQKPDPRWEVAAGHMIHNWVVHRDVTFGGCFSEVSGSYVKTHPFTLSAALAQGGVTVQFNDKMGFNKKEQDDGVPLTVDERRQMLRAYGLSNDVSGVFDAQGNAVDLSSLDAPPTPNTSNEERVSVLQGRDYSSMLASMVRKHQ
jgi:hypothetical protein